MKGKHFEKSKPTHNLPQYIYHPRKNKWKFHTDSPYDFPVYGDKVGMGGKTVLKTLRRNQYVAASSCSKEGLLSFKEIRPLHTHTHEKLLVCYTSMTMPSPPLEIQLASASEATSSAEDIF